MKNTLAIVGAMVVLCTSVQAQTVNKMTVKVKVRSGATMSMDQHLRIEYAGFKNTTPSMFKGEGSFSFITTPNTEVLVSQKSRAQLVNQYGEHIYIESETTKKSDLLNGNHLIAINTSVDCAKVPRGTYRGDFNTVIEYL